MYLNVVQANMTKYSTMLCVTDNDNDNNRNKNFILNIPSVMMIRHVENWIETV